MRKTQRVKKTETSGILKGKRRMKNMQKTEEEYNEIISSQDAEIKKLKEELMHATKPSVFFSSMKNRIRSGVREFFDREG